MIRVNPHVSSFSRADAVECVRQIRMETAREGGKPLDVAARRLMTAIADDLIAEHRIAEAELMPVEVTNSITDDACGDPYLSQSADGRG